MVLGIEPTVDYAFKRLFGDPNHSRVLVHLLNAIFEGQFEVSEVEILTPFLEKDFEEDKLAVLDLRVRDTAGRHYNLEMQTSLPMGLPNRLAYYLSCMYCEQLVEGDSYTKLAPAISICFLDRVMFSQVTDFHTRFRLCSLEHELVLTDQLEVHLLELPKYGGSLADLPQARAMEKWVYFLLHAGELEGAEIVRWFSDAAFIEAGGILEMISKTPEERLRYDMRMKALRDQVTNLEAAKLEGIAAGREEGIAAGREEGRWIGKIQTLQELLGEVVSTSEELGTWELDRLMRWAESLQARLRARPQT